MSTWKETLKEQLLQQYGAQKGAELNTKYQNSFSHSYIDDYSIEMALSDISEIEQLSSEHEIGLRFYYSPKDIEHKTLHLRLFQWKKNIPLSDVLPILENLNLRTENETPHKILLEHHQIVCISDFLVTYKEGSFDINEVKGLFKDAFIKVYQGQSENDGFNKLILGAALSWREVTLLRTYAKYLRQVSFRFSQEYIESALIKNIGITKNLINLFFSLHEPNKVSIKLADTTERTILEQLDKVTSLDEDRIIRRIYELIKATLRTNYFQTTADGAPKHYLSIKLSSKNIPELPLPIPLYEIFVYSTSFEAIHLRNARIARGGIRWSDRREDFRTEVLGLMKAQVVKNSIIVPSGAKGGFVLKTTNTFSTREELQKEVIYCYKSFIRGLLDLTDNIINGKIIPPVDVVCYDEPDTYLVVAADKGTATFSDIANELSEEYHFWLGDAFASGGSEGYDHKKIGITARGAWESIKRHFRELNINIATTDITVVGIGDMSGDVFGNGMIYSKHIKLIAAFDHRDIFIDPNPQTDVSYEERVRLFNQPNSSWKDYNILLISPGGGVFSRALKSISLTPEIQIALGIEDTSLTPNDLIKAILKAPVDLLFNGGIGTYVKSSTQSNNDVSDRTNDYCRVNGDELRTKVVGEGGNLGFTQLGRIEYAMKGGLINTDFIDNSAGVDCSDHEVNLKILLREEIQKGNLTYEERNKLLFSLTDEVADLVLKDNYFQALVMSFSAYSAVHTLTLYTNYIQELVSTGLLNRKVEFLPNDKELAERKAAEKGLTRPEIAVVLAYTKIYIKEEILKSNLLTNPYLSRIVETAFPDSVREKYKEAMKHHRLHGEIIANQLSNHLVNQMGITFVYHLQMETGANVDEIVRAYTVASQVFQSRDLQKLIESLDFQIPMSDQYDMLFNVRKLIHLATRWFLRTYHINDDLAKTIDYFAPRINQLAELTPQLMSGSTKIYYETISKTFIKAGITEGIARRIAAYRAMYTCLNIIEVAGVNNFDLIQTAEVYFAAGERLNLLWFRDQIGTDNREGHWNTLARLSLRDELDFVQRTLTTSILIQNKNEPTPKEKIDAWIADNQRALERWDRLLAMLHSSTNIDYTMFFIALRELMGLIEVNG